MNIKTTIFLLALLIGIGIYFLVFEKGRTGTTDTGPEGAEKPLFTADDVYPEGTTSLTITWDDGSTAAMTRDKDGHWMQTAPVRFPMQPVRVQGIVNDACFLRYVDKFLPDQDGKPTLANTTLDKPRVTVRLTGKTQDVKIDPATGKSEIHEADFDKTIYLGGTLTGSRGYVRVEKDANVYVVNHSLHNLLLRERPTEWRASTFETPNDAQADRISLSAEGQVIDLMKIGSDWQFGAPLRDRVAPKVPGAILGLLRRSEIGRFVDDNPKDLAAYGLDKPDISISVHTTSIEPRLRTLRIGNAADPQGASYHASWSLGDEPSRVVFTVLRDTRARFLAPKADDLRDPRITPIKTTGVKELLVQVGDQPAVRLERLTTGWAFAAAEKDKPLPPYKPDADAVGQLIEALTTTGARYYHAGGRKGTPLATVTISSSIPPTGPDTLTFYPMPPEARPAADDTPLVMAFRNNEGTGYLVAKEKLARLFEPTIKLRDRQILDVKLESLKRIFIKRSDGVVYSFQQSSTAVDDKLQWTMGNGDLFEREMLAFLAKQISSLRAETWLPEPVKLGPNTVTVTIDATGNRAAVLTVDLETRYATIDGVDGMFVVEEKHRMMFDAEYRPRNVLALAPGDIAKITLTKAPPEGTKPTPFAFIKDDLNRYMMLDAAGTPQPFPKIDPRKAAAVFGMLTPLRAWRLVTKPAGVEAKDAMNTVEVVTSTNQRHTIAIGFKDQPALANIKDTWFTLDPETLSRLLAEPKEDEPAKKGDVKKDK